MGKRWHLFCWNYLSSLPSERDSTCLERYFETKGIIERLTNQRQVGHFIFESLERGSMPLLYIGTQRQQEPSKFDELLYRVPGTVLWNVVCYIL